MAHGLADLPVLPVASDYGMARHHGSPADDRPGTRAGATGGDRRAAAGWGLAPPGRTFCAMAGSSPVA
jgi:hypothetical protein